METKFQKIEVTREFAYDVNKWLDTDEPKPLKPGESDVVTMTARFDDGIEAVIKVFYGQSDCSNNTYIDAILLEDGCEVDNANPIEDTLLREFYFYHKKVEYVVDVVFKDESQNEPTTKEIPDVKTKHQKIEITRAFADEVQKWLDVDEPKELESGESDVKTMTADFGNGIEADVKVCYGQHNTYIDAVLFKDGSEVCVEASEEILGPIHFEYEGVEYIVDVVLEPGNRFQKIEVTEEFADEVQKYLDAEDGTMVHDCAPSYDILAADFGNGLRFEIRICYEHDTNFINPILYLNDIEISSFDNEYDLIEKYGFVYKDEEYEVEVKIASSNPKSITIYG